MRLNNSYKFFCIDQSRFYIFLHSRHLKIIYQNLKIFFSFLKELRNCNWKLFLCPPKKQAKTQPPFWTAIFLDKFTLAYQSNYLNIKRNKFISHKQYLLVFSSLKAQRGLTQTNVYHKFFLLCLKRNDSPTFKSTATAKNLFSSVHVIGTTSFEKFIVTLRFFSIAMFLRWLKNVIWNKFVF